MAPAGSGEPEVHRITAAQKPHSDDLDARMGRYLISMLIRTLCFVLVFVIHNPVRWVFVAGAVFLPYVAVVFANAGGTRRPTAPPTAVTPRAPRQLEAQRPDPEHVRIFRPDAGEPEPRPEQPVAQPARSGTQDPPAAAAEGAPGSRADAREEPAQSGPPASEGGAGAGPQGHPPNG